MILFYVDNTVVYGINNTLTDSQIAEELERSLNARTTEEEIDFSVGYELHWTEENGFWNEEIEEPVLEPTQLDTIEESQLSIMEALADQYEEQQAQQLDTQEVLATIYEAVIGE